MTLSGPLEKPASIDLTQLSPASSSSHDRTTLPRYEGSFERELDTLVKSKLGQAELESWWHIYGIAAFRDGRQQEATARFEEAYRRFPKSPHIRFSLGQQYVNARQLDRGFELFRSCMFPDVPRGYVLAQVRYAYLWDRYDDGRLMLRPFFKAYKELKILDDHFLYVRGLPFFGAWWSYLAALSILSGDRWHDHLHDLATASRA